MKITSYIRLENISKILFSLSLISLNHTAIAQQENTMYFMDRVTYVSTLNPSITPACKFYLGGLLMPISGQLPPSMHMSVFTPVSYSDVIYRGEGDYKDSLITPLFSQDHFNDFKKRLREQNVFSTEVNLPMLNFGFRIKKKHFINFSITEKFYANTVLPKDLFIFPVEGNGDHDEITFNGIAFNASAYREYALGYKHEINKYFKVGATIKYLNGYYNVYSQPSNITLSTDRTEAQLRLNTDMQINTSLPVDSVKTDADGNVEDIATRSPSNDDLKELFIFSPNRGIALDFGLVKDYNSEISLYASAVDIGFMNWNKDPYSYNLQGNQVFEGVKIDSLNFDEALGEFKIDSMFTDYQYKATRGRYKQWLPSKFYLGADYRLKRWVKLGLLYRAEYSNKHLFHAATASVNFKYAKFANTSISYTIKNNSFYNVGLGTSYIMGPINMFFISDNIGALIWWHKSQLFAFRMGTSLVFGVKDKRKARSSVPLLSQYDQF